MYLTMTLTPIGTATFNNMSDRRGDLNLTVGAIVGECTVLYGFGGKTDLRQYVLGFRMPTGQTDQAVSYRTAAKTMAEMTAWQAETASSR